MGESWREAPERGTPSKEGEPLSRVRRSQLHSVSAVGVGAAKTSYPLASSSFPNGTRCAGLPFGNRRNEPLSHGLAVTAPLGKGSLEGGGCETTGIACGEGGRTSQSRLCRASSPWEGEPRGVGREMTGIACGEGGRTSQSRPGRASSPLGRGAFGERRL